MLKGKQRKCLELMIITDMTQKEIANELKISEQTICNWKKDKEFKYEFNEAMKEAINYSAKNAYNEMLNLLKAKSELVRFQAAKDLLDRSGYNPTEKLEVNGDMGVKIVDDIPDKE